MYQVLYRKYRPKVFSDVVGQEHITTTLSNEIESGKLSHAYLFTGSRGTGKTTCAKILAKAVNCQHPHNGNPCNECDVCKGLDSGAILDVVEIDAASNNGVDNIRDIRDESNFAPVNCKYRVYIIDEVHMLSIGAFNALLKTLEEPPEHVMFILATTEVHKLPVTILSRCQRFDFKRVSPEAMLQRMNVIASEEGFTLDENAATLIARLADGGMRDALSILDQCIGRNRHVTAELVYEVAGITGKDHLFDLADSIAKNDTAKAVEKISVLHSSSCDMERLCSDLIQHFRNLMIAKTVRNAGNVLICTKQELQSYVEQSSLFTLEAILYSIDLLQTAAANIKKGVNRRIEMEMTLIRISNPALDTDNKALLRRIASLELALKSGAVVKAASAAQPTAANYDAPEEKQEESKPQTASKEADASTDNTQPAEAFEPSAGTEQPEDEQRREEPAEAVSNDESFSQWAQVLSELSEINKPIWGILLGSTAFIRNDFVLIKSENPTFVSFIKTGTNARDVREAIFRATGRKYRLGIYNNQSEQKEEKPTDPLQGLISHAREMGVNVSVE